MRLLESVWDMRRGFTLIEVMVAVLIVSVVVMALYEMRGNSTHIFINLEKKSKISQFSSLFISNSDYGYENRNVTMDKLISDFDVERNLKEELKKAKVELIYQKLESIDMREFDSGDKADSAAADEAQNSSEVNSNLIFEIGKSILKTDETSTGFIRFRIQS